MLKAATIKLLLARSICSGKFLIAIAGDVASVTTAVEAGGAAAGASLIERRQIARVHPPVLQAISQSVEIDPKESALHRRHRNLLRGQHHRCRRRRRQIRQRHAAARASGHGPRRQRICA